MERKNMGLCKCCGRSLYEDWAYYAMSPPECIYSNCDVEFADYCKVCVMLIISDTRYSQNENCFFIALDNICTVYENETERELTEFEVHPCP